MVAQAAGKRRRARRSGEPVEVHLKPKRRPPGRNVTPPKTSRIRKPEEMKLEDWQIALRREFGREQTYRLKNIGQHPIFSEFEVSNPQMQRAYRVAIRGQRPGDNYCSCVDFAVNTLGTCKHIEFTLSKLERTRGGKTAFKAGFHPEYSEIFVLYGARRRIAFRAGTTCPDEPRKLAARSFDADGILKPGAEGHLAPLVTKAGELGHELRCYDDVWDFVAQLRDDVLRKQRIDEHFAGNGRSAWKQLLKVSLYPYQEEGALFAARAGRAILADDMGLGKTIQAIAATEILARAMSVERVLVVCPTSLKHQWKQEIEKFSARSAVVVEGFLAGRRKAYESDAFYKITNYDVVHRDREMIDRWAPELIILDEAQRIKNWQTRRARSIKQLKSEYALVLTGTPLENRLEELHSIVEFVDRFHLGPLFRFVHEHQDSDETGRAIGYRNLSQISKSLQPILLRRHKDAVLAQLPERLDKRFFVPMTPEQMKHHDENRDIVAKIVYKWRKCGFLSEKDQRRLMIALQFMRMSCNSTYLLDPKTDFGYKADEAASFLTEVFEEPDAKAVVFSQWLGTHELLLRRFESRPWGHVFFHGGVPGPQRKDLIQRFKEDENCRLFLSTDAGGVGLNLQNASVVVNMDQPWNPAVLEQRIGRVHRLGQQRPVRVVDFVSERSIEHTMLNVLKFKKSLFAGVLDGGADHVALGGTRLARLMETVEQVTEAIPEPPTDGRSSLEAAAEQLLAATEDVEITEEHAGNGRGSLAPENAISSRGSLAPERHTAEGGRATTTERAWEEVISAGASLVAQLGRVLLGPEAGAALSQVAAQLGGSGETEGSATSFVQGIAKTLVQRDERTGQACLKIPMPTAETLKKLLGFVRSLAAS